MGSFVCLRAIVFAPMIDCLQQSSETLYYWSMSNTQRFAVQR